MKKIVILLAALGVGAGLHAQDPRSSYSVTSDFAYSSEYVFRGIKKSGSAFQPSIEATVQDFYAGVWTNQPITKHQNNELDLYAGYKYKVASNLTVEAVGTYYWYPESNGWLTRHSWEAGVGATYTIVRGVNASVYYYRDFTLDANTVQGSVGYSLPLEAIGASLDVTGFVGNVDADNWTPQVSPKMHESYTYYGLDVAVPYKLSERATFTVGAHWARNHNLTSVTPLSDGNDSHLWWTAGVTIGF